MFFIDLTKSFTTFSRAPLHPFTKNTKNQIYSKNSSILKYIIF